MLLCIFVIAYPLLKKKPDHKPYIFVPRTRGKMQAFNFNSWPGSNGVALPSSVWTQQTPNATIYTDGSGHLYASQTPGPGFAIYTNNTAPASANYTVASGVYTHGEGAGFSGVVARLSGGQCYAYYALFTGPSTQTVIAVLGSPLGTTESPLVNDSFGCLVGDILTLTVSGSTLTGTVTRSGVIVDTISVVDTTITAAGLAGIVMVPGALYELGSFTITQYSQTDLVMGPLYTTFDATSLVPE